jgi:hypothetical protein
MVHLDLVMCLVLDLQFHVLFLSCQLIWTVILLTNMMNSSVFLTSGKIIKDLTLISLF